MAEKKTPEPLNLGNGANEEILDILEKSFNKSFDEGLMKDPAGKSPFYYNGVPILSKADECDIGEILSSVLNIFLETVQVKFIYIADELADRLNGRMFELFKEKFISAPGKFSPFYFEDVAIFPRSHEGGNLNKLIDETKVLFLFDIRGY